METTEHRDKNFYGNLSKKELQDWCNKYGLAPCGRGSELVNSLNFYFEKRNPSPVSLLEGSSVHSTSLLPPAQLCACMRDIADGREDNFVANRGKINELLQRKVFESSKKESHNQILDIRRSARLNKNIEIPRTKNVLEIEQQPTQNAPVPTERKSDSGRYFEVHARSERGLNMFVDLSCTSIDYYRQMGKQVLVDINKQKEKKFGSFREEVLSLGSNRNQAKKSLHQTTNEETTPIISVDQDSNCDCSDESCGGRTAEATDEKEIENPASGTEIADLCGQDKLATRVRPKRRKTADLGIPNSSTSGNQHKIGLRRSKVESKNPGNGTKVLDGPCVQHNMANPVRAKRKAADLEIANNSTSTSGYEQEKIILLRSGKLKSGLRRFLHLFHKVANILFLLFFFFSLARTLNGPFPQPLFSVE